MKALVYEAPKVMTLRDIGRPQPSRGEVLLRVAYSGICGSELSGFLGQNSLRKAPLVFGHELSGVVEQLGEEAVEGVNIGDRVTANPLISCGRCQHCVSARHQLCPDRLLLGASLPGSNAEYVVVPATALETVPAGLHLRDAALAEPAACAVHAVSLSGATPADTALVIGAGPIGLFLIQVLKAYGLTQILVTDRNLERCRMAADLGAIPVDSDGSQMLLDVDDLTDRTGVTVAFDAAGTEATRRNCLEAVAPGGRLMFVGLHTDETSLPINTMIRREVTAHGVFAYTPDAFRTALTWLANGRLGLREGVVEARLEDGPGWYQRLVDGDPAAKVLLRPSPSDGIGDGAVA